MFTNQKIEPAQWPWAYLQVTEKPDRAAWIELSHAIPVILPEGSIGSGRDIRFTFKDTYIDLNREVEFSSEISERVDWITALPPSRRKYL